MNLRNLKARSSCKRLAFAAFAFVLALGAFAQTKKGQGEQRLYLVHADRALYDQTKFDGARRAVGKVHFRQGVNQLYSDSAAYNERTGKFEAFGHVRYVQGDTIVLTGNRLLYDSQAEKGYMTGHDVTLKHPRGTLITDSVLYNAREEIAEYFTGGKLLEKGRTLTSEQGRLFMKTGQTFFKVNVKLVSEKYTITTNNMEYNLNSKWAHVTGPSNILSKDNNIYTDNAYYNVQRDEARLLQGSRLYMPGNRELTGDSLHYDKPRGVANVFGPTKYIDRANDRTVESRDGLYKINERVFYGENEVLFTDHKKKRTIRSNRGEYHERERLFKGEGRVVSEDNIRHTRLTCDRGEYYERTEETKAYGHVNYLDKPKQRRVTCERGDFNDKTKDLHAEGNVMFHDLKNRRVFTCARSAYNDTTKVLHAYAPEGGFAHGYDSIQHQDVVARYVKYDDMSGWLSARRDVEFHDLKRKYDFRSHFVDYNDRLGCGMATDSAIVADRSRQGQELYVHADTIWIDSYERSTGELYIFDAKRKLPKGYQQDSLFRVVRGEGRVRAFSPDIQAVCDTLTYDERERLLTLQRDPIVWNENRQILGEEIKVFLCETESQPKPGQKQGERRMSIDSIHVDRQALVCEQVLRGDTVHFNQVSGERMRSYFRDGEVHENRVFGNVRIVNFPLERDSTIVYQNYLETARFFMTMEKRKLVRLWAPAAKGCFYPLGGAPRSETYLDNFAWFDYIRPQDADDLLLWRGKSDDMRLRARKRRTAPLQRFS